MASSAELSMFNAKTAFAIPTLDYSVGMAPSLVLMKSYKSLPSSGANITYDKTSNTVKVAGNNVVLDHYDFSGANVVVTGNNVKITNSKFDASVGSHTVRQMDGYSGLVIDHNTFDGGKVDRPLADFIFGGTGKVTITYNEFKNAPSDAVNIQNGVVDHNYFSGTGYMTGAHADAISIDGTTGPITITNNFIDSRKVADAKVEATSTIAIGNYYGDTKNVTVKDNVLLGGAYTVYVQDFGTNTMKNVAFTDNYVDAGLFGNLYPNRRPADLVYSESAAPNVVESTSAKPSAGLKVVGKAGVIGEVLEGGVGSDYLYGHGDGNKLVGGGGRDFLFGGKGEDIFTYKAASDSKVGQADVIGGFQVGIDKIDLSALATHASALTFIGGAAFNGAPGAVHAVHSGALTLVEVDLNGDKVADLQVQIQGNVSLTNKDFIFASLFDTIILQPNLSSLIPLVEINIQVNLASAAPEHMNAIFRFFDTLTGDHFYSSSATEKAHIQATIPTFNYEGSPWSTPNESADTHDVFRFFDTKTGTHFFTDSVNERDGIIANVANYKYEGVAFEAYNDPSGSGHITLERFFNTQTGQHHFAGSDEEAASINQGFQGPGWIHEGKAFTVHVLTENILNA